MTAEHEVGMKIIGLKSAAVISVVLAWIVAGGASTDSTNQKATSAMKDFVLLFRQDPSTHLSDADQKRRAEEVRAWAMRQNNEGRKLDPRILTPENQRVNPAGKSNQPADDAEGVVVAITFLEARDFAEAARIAASHPGLNYGVSVEVREWTSPAPAPK